MQIMCSIKFKRLITSIIVIGILLTLIQIYLVSRSKDEITSETIVLWWTPFGSLESTRKCGMVECFFTQNRAYITHQRLKGILFYGSNLEIDDLPIPRGNDVRWGLLHEESPRNNLMLVHDEALRLFNFSATFSRHSDLPMTLLDLPSLEILSDLTYFRTTNEKNRLIEEGLAPVLYIQSNCDTVNDRDSYVKELMKFIRVDSYGTCLNNRQLPKSLRENYIDNLDSSEFRKFVAQYKFTLAFENANCDDYITEKLWRPLIVGSVPVYSGSPSFKDWIPNNSSVISVQDFQGPKDLANFLLLLLNDNEKYEKYLSHKLTKNGINNLNLVNELRKRPGEILNIFEHNVRSFECLVCEKLYENIRQTATKEHYNCPKPESILKTGDKLKNWWTDSWDSEACLAKLLSQYVSQNKSINLDKLTAEKKKCRITKSVIKI